MELLLTGYRKVLRDNIQGVTRGDIRRLARRGGVKRISGDIYAATREQLKLHLEKVCAIVDWDLEAGRVGANARVADSGAGLRDRGVPRQEDCYRHGCRVCAAPLRDAGLRKFVARGGRC